MKILYIDPSKLDYMGGSHKSLLSIMTEMTSRGNDVILGTPGICLLSSEAQKEGINFFPFILPKLLETRITWRGRRFFNLFAAAFDVFIIILSGLSIFRLIRKLKPDIVHSNQMLISIAVLFS